MKLKKYIWLAALPIALTACQDDALVENPTGRGITTLSCTMEGGLPDSRAQIVFGGTSTTAEYFHWNAGDAFTLYESIEGGNLTEHKFKIYNYDEAAPSANATFKTESQSGLASGNTFVAYYPEVKAGENGAISLSAPVNEISVTEEKNEDAAWKEYFQQSMYMVAQGTVGTSSLDTKLKFEHLCGLIRITYTNETEESVSVENISLNGNWGTGILLSNKSVDATDFEQDSENTQELELTLSGVSIAPDESKDFYLLFIPPHGQDVIPMSYINIDGKKTPETYMGKKFSVSGFEAGQSYWFNVTNTGDEETLAWTKELHSEDLVPPMNSIMECGNSATLKAALASEIVKQIILTKDIALLSPMEINHPVMVNLNGKKLTLGEGYIPDDTDAVFNVTALNSVQIVNGDIECAQGAKIQDYLFKLSGNGVNFVLSDINVVSGGMVPDIIYMDGDNLRIYSGKGEGEEQKVTNISTTGNVIYSETKKSDVIYTSDININGTLTGNFYFRSSDNARNYLNTELTIASAKIMGNLVFDGVADNYKSKRIKYHYQNVEIDDQYLTDNSWKQAKKYADDQERTINNLEDLKKYLAEPQVLDEMTRITFKKLDDNGEPIPFEISLDAPLTINKPVHINLNGNTLSVPSSFKWDGSEAAITCTSGFTIYEGTVTGECVSTTTGKYIFKASNPEYNMTFMGVTLNATGMNAVKIVDSEFRVGDSRSATNITVGEGFNAIYAVSNTHPIYVYIEMLGKITGNIGYDLNYYNEEFPSVIDFNRGTIVGNLVASPNGTKNDFLKVLYGNGVSIPEGWPTAFDMMKQAMESTGDYWCEGVLSVPNDVTLTLDSDFEMIRFTPEMLDGKGTITFKQDVRSETPQVLMIGIPEISDGVDFKFDGNFKKEIYVGSTQIKKVMSWAQNQDQVEITLTGNVEITEQLTSSSLVMNNSGEDKSEPGQFMINLNNYTLSSNLNQPAIVWKGGLLQIMNGTMITTSHAIQVGASIDDDKNNAIVLSVFNTAITSDGYCVFATADETEQKQYKYVEINVGKGSVLKSNEKGTVAMDGKAYIPGGGYCVLNIEDATLNK